jgi:UDPglucose 6-dehydrogenase
MGRSLGLDLFVVQAAIRVNQRQRHFIPDKILDRFGGRLQGRRFAVWGMAFKANTDDLRESPALGVVDMLLDHRATVTAYDPQAMDNVRRNYADRIILAPDAYAALNGADALIVATEWNEFRRPDFERMKQLMRTRIVFDGRNLFDPAPMRDLGFEYFSVGRP